MNSHHSHSGSFCAHAKGTLEEVIVEAIRKGFRVYGLSEHVPRYRAHDLYPEEESLGLASLSRTFAEYLNEASRVKSEYGAKITVLIGAETEYITQQDLDELDKLLSDGRIEYIVGSVHHVAECPIDFDETTWKTALSRFAPPNPTEPITSCSTTLSGYFCAYFEAQFTLLKHVHPEVIGHFDLCRLYIPNTKLDDPKLAGVWEKVKRNVEYAVSYGALFEVNAAAFRKGWEGSCYPGEEVLRFILEKGGRLCLSDDSHGPQAVGLNYTKLREYLARVGVDSLWFLEGAEESNAAGRKIIAKQWLGWKEDVAWGLM